MSEPAPGDALRAFAAAVRPRIEEVLEGIVPPEDEEPRTLHRAMRHALFPGGKRLRPVLALIACRATGGDEPRALRPAAAIELLHTYSLVHDDLPCMDDDALRRGRPTCHVAFGEAAAVLAGDALLTLAFEVVAEGGAAAVAALARAAGSLGMVGGQMADLEAEGREGDRTGVRVEWIHDRKTAALIRASLEVGALAGGGRTDTIPELRRFGMLVGRAFQIADDCLDLTGDAAELGKTPGQDLAADKLTYPAVVGLEESRQKARELASRAFETVPGILAGSAARAELDDARQLLQDVASYAVSRTR